MAHPRKKQKENKFLRIYQHTIHSTTTKSVAMEKLNAVTKNYPKNLKIKNVKSQNLRKKDLNPYKLTHNGQH